MIWLTIIMITICTALPLFHVMNALGALREKDQYNFHKDTKNMKGISVLVPCYNEEVILSSTIQGVRDILKVYPHAEFIFINDGSSDRTLDVLTEELGNKISLKSFAKRLTYQLVLATYKSTRLPNTYIIDKNNGGKADSLNAGIDFASNDIIVTLDADTILEKNSLHVINSAFEDENVIAGGGLVNIIQGGQMSGKGLSLGIKYIVRFQIFEYLKGFMIYKTSLARSNALSVISGAFGIFRKSILLEVGGYRNTVGEDIDITMKFQKYVLDNKGKKILFLPHAICYTECPESWRDLFKQRVRWQKAFVDCLIIYFRVMLRSIFKRSVSFFFIVDAFIVGTLATSFTLVYLVYLLTLGYSEKSFFIIGLYLALSVTLNLISCLAALYIIKRHGMHIANGSRKHLVMTILGELFFFRFVFMFYVMVGSLLYFVNKEGWNKVQRTGNKYLEKAS
ncbi:glycosyltransferase family 2 protein [Bacillus sp. FJAT-45037]|uniref:glycosyltransferase family 2 protein n=1 Tax=Bacillus sp. FJAT-45037 TaxID=2011007 RepID=UPI000C249C08|nr:glycosyltransferase family 2 protein [Bacillus sp. FJAT-45037]